MAPLLGFAGWFGLLYWAIGRNTGKWTVDHQKAVLFLDSEVEDDDNEWKVSFNADLMIWTGIGHPRKEETRLVHKRKL